MISESIKKPIKNVLNFFKAFFLLLKIHIEGKLNQSEIVFFFPYYHTGGAESVHIAILKALQDKKCTVIFTQGSATKNLFDEFKNQARLIELNPILNKKNNWINYKLKKKLITSINSSQSIKAVFGCNTSYFYDLLPNIKESIKKIDLFHAFEDNDIREKELVSSVSYISKRIVINNKAKNDIITFYKKNNINETYNDRIKIIGNGIDLTNKIIQKKSDTLKIGFIGRWSPEKRPILFLKIANRIKTVNPSIQFVMAGTGMKTNKNLILDSKVEFLGEITNKKVLNELYDSLNILLVTSKYEGFPMVIMEGMSFGVIPISTNVGGINEHIKNRKNGILIDDIEEPEIIESFCKAIIELHKNPEFLNKLTNESFLYAKENFGIEKFNESYNKLFSY